MQPLIESRRSEVVELCRRHRVRRLDLFGSSVRADFDPETSDLDFLVELEPVTPAAYADAYFSLKEALEALFQRRVDLVTSSSLVNPYFRESVAAARENVYAA
jgi:predicted nucleotidyltransferase